MSLLPRLLGKSVAVNAKGQQGAASKPATVKVKKAPKGTKKP
jgi:hypothetical protein